jgi:hypothetical protein
MTTDPADRPAWRRWRPGVLAWALWALAISGLAAVAWLDRLLRQTGRPELLVLGPKAIPPVLGAVSAGTVGAVLAARRPRHPVGWLQLGLGLSLCAAGLAAESVNYALAHLAGLPAASLIVGYVPATIVTAICCNGLVLLLTPTGTLPSASPGWRWWARLTAATPVAVLLVVTFAPKPGSRLAQPVQSPLDLHALGGGLRLAYQAAFAVAIFALVVAAASLVGRFGRARGIERQQLRWVAWAALVVAPLFVVDLAALALGAFAVAAVAGGACPPVLSGAIGAAILRYRLYDLDRIISRTVAYGLLTVLLGGGYAALVLGLGQLVGQASPLLVAGATLAVAAVFQPARRRIQQAVDRRFDRRRYDAGRTIQQFGARLRQQLDLDGLTRELLGVVEQTMQPTRVSLWLRPQRPSGRAGGDGAVRNAAGTHTSHPGR